MKRLLAGVAAVVVGTMFSLSAFGLNDQHLLIPLRVLAVAGFFWIGFWATYRVVKS